VGYNGANHLKEPINCLRKDLQCRVKIASVHCCTGQISTHYYFPKCRVRYWSI